VQRQQRRAKKLTFSDNNVTFGTGKITLRHFGIEKVCAFQLTLSTCFNYTLIKPIEMKCSYFKTLKTFTLLNP